MEKYGFVYIWRDRKYNRYYVGSHWGFEDDGYVCSSKWMYMSFKRRPDDFGGRKGRKILKTNISSKQEMYEEEQRWLNMIKKEEIGKRYYNLKLTANGGNGCPEGIGKNISVAKKGKILTEEHKQALRGIKKGPHTDEWKAENSKRMKEIWSSEKGQKRKEDARILVQSEEHRAKLTAAKKGTRPSEECKQASIKKVSKTYRVVSPQGEETVIMNLKAFCREKGLTDINMVRKSGSKGWFAYRIEGQILNA